MDKNTLNQLLTNAERSFRKQQYILARVELEKVISVFPENTKANELLAYISSNEGDQTLAFRFLDVACRDKNCSAEAMYYFGSMHLQQNQLRKAVVLFESSLEKAGDFFEALHELGVAQSILGEKTKALRYFKKALSLRKNSFQLLFNIAKTYDELKNYDLALKFYSKVNEINPSFALAWSNRGIVLNELNRFDEALNDFDKAIQIQPKFFEAFFNKSITYNELKLYELSLQACDQAVQINPEYAMAYSMKGRTLCELKQYEEALLNVGRAIELSPEDSEMWLSRAIVMISLQKYHDATQDINKAIDFNPKNDSAWSLKGLLHLLLADYQSANNFIEKALHINPLNAVAWFNKAQIFLETGQYELVLEPLKNALQLKPHIKYLRAYYTHSKLYMGYWEDLHEDIHEVLKKSINCEPAAPPLILSLLIDDPQQHLDAARMLSRDKYIEITGVLPNLNKYSHAKLRIGYFSADFKHHPVSLLTAELFELHNREKFEIIAFSLQDAKPNDPVRPRLIDAFDQFIDVSNKSERGIAQLSRNLEIDIAIDLGGHTIGSKTTIFSYRAAPIQISYIGYLGTMGVDYFDYLIADKTIIPLEAQKYYSEKIIYLPCYQVNDRKRKISGKGFTRKELGLPESGFVFACFNNSYKYQPTTFNSWMKILKAVEGSVLFLYASNTVFQENIKKEAQKRGIKPHRIVFGKRISSDEYLARYQVCDLFLDTLPYNAGATASDALWAGLPLLTLIGKSFPSRYAASLLVAMGLPELITYSQEEYELLAIDLATNPEKLRKIKIKLIRHRETTLLFDTPKFTKFLELAYTNIYNRYQANLPPENIFIEE